MRIVPVTLREANAYIREHHRHHGRVQGCKFCIGAQNDTGRLCGVAIVGRPVSRILDNGRTAEVTRLCTDGTRNACSFLYGACARIARNMGYLRIHTYLLETENGASLRASGWEYGGLCGGGNWNCASRPRQDSTLPCKKIIYTKRLERDTP